VDKRDAEDTPLGPVAGFWGAEGAESMDNPQQTSAKKAVTNELCAIPT
jgi:hypothetical protein